MHSVMILTECFDPNVHQKQYICQLLLCVRTSVILTQIIFIQHLTVYNVFMKLFMKVASLVKRLHSLRRETLASSWALTRYSCGLVFLSLKSQIAPKATAIENTSGSLRLSSTVTSRHSASSTPKPTPLSNQWLMGERRFVSLLISESMSKFPPPKHGYFNSFFNSISKCFKYNVTLCAIWLKSKCLIIKTYIVSL